MAYTVRKVEYYKVSVSNRAGEGAKLLAPLAAGGVNLLAFTGFPQGRKAQVDFVPEKPVAFKRVAMKAKIRLGPRKFALLVQGDDRPGAVAEIAAKLAAAKINITAMDAVSAGGGRFGAILWVKPPSLAKAAKVLGAR